MVRIDLFLGIWGYELESRCEFILVLKRLEIGGM